MAPHVNEGASTALLRETSLSEPLLSTNGKRPESSFSSEDLPIDGLWGHLKFGIRLLLKGVIMVALGLWLGAWIALPTEWYQYSPSVRAFRTSLMSPALGLSGPILVTFGAPPLVIALVAPIYLALGESEPQKRPAGRPSLLQRLWTYPLLVRGPMGVVSAGELLAWLGLLGLLLWVLGLSLGRQLLNLHMKPQDTLTLAVLRAVGINLGLASMLLISVLFLPVARGSVLLRLVAIPWEHAVRYHVWVGHLLMVVLCGHGGAYLAEWTLRGDLWQRVTAWQTIGVANLPGVLALLAGIAIWITALKPVRESQFELFFNTHQLYVIFILGLALHCGDFVLSITLPGLLLFTIDRLLRTVQSRSTVGVRAARLLPCGALELVIPTAPDLHYPPLSFVFLHERRSALLEWHPFSVASSALATPGSLTLLIKPLGAWTKAVSEAATKESASSPSNQKPAGGCPLAGLKLGLEGPYGHVSDFYLRSNAILLVGGGIGVVPLVAILRDILHRYRLHQRDLPSDITLVWAVKHAAELEAIRGVSPRDICPNVAHRFQFRVLPFVTQEESPDPEQGPVFEASQHVTSWSLGGEDDLARSEAAMGTVVGTTTDVAEVQGVKNGQTLELCALTAQPTTGSASATVLLLLSSTLGVLFFMAVFGQFVIFPSDQGTYRKFPWWGRGSLACLALLLGVGLFGGAVVLLDHLYTRWLKVRVSSTKMSGQGALVPHGASETGKGSLPFDADRVIYGARPNLAEVFAGLGKRFSNENIPVLVSGPASLQSAVATECRAAGMASFEKDSTMFSYYSVSFEL